MALIVETGNGAADSEAYASVAHADTYLANRGMTLWATMSVTEKEWTLRRATDYLSKIYAGLWSGQRATATQALDWPRKGVFANGYHVAENIVPREVRNSTIELAFRAAYGPLASESQPGTSTEQAIKSEKVGPIETEYFGTAVAVNQTYSAVDIFLKPFLMSQAGGYRLTGSFGF